MVFIPHQPLILHIKLGFLIKVRVKLFSSHWKGYLILKALPYSTSRYKYEQQHTQDLQKVILVDCGS